MKTFNKVSVTVLTISLALGLFGINSAIAAGPSAINLGSAGNFTILSKTGVSTTGVTSVVGDIGVSPAQATYITGFALDLSVGSAYSTSPLVAGKVYAPGYADPTPANLTSAIGAMETAYTDGVGRTNPTATELGAGNIAGMTLAPGLYKWGTGVTISTDVTLSGSANDVWIFQIAQNLNVSSGAGILLSGGAQASNVFWVVAGQTTIGTTAVFNGIILDQTAIVLNTGATLNGRALAQSAVTLDSNSVNAPTAASSIVSIPVAVTTPTQVTTTSYSGESSYTPPAQVAYITQADAVNDSGCAFGNKFSTVTGRSCVSQAASTNMASATDAGCIPGNKFSTVTGKNCGSQAGASSAFGQQVRNFAKNLWKGTRDADVKSLQDFLVAQNKGPAAQALANITTTTYFGEMTLAAVAEYQASVGISPASGNFGPITRAYISSH
ncbi:MAG: hypothetical protein COV32_03115 [Candidatus Yonathbacteria bacterium CG10_big_fil_rev_8_21_14_0_10_43_136]|uniref:Peptidoglycan binding-like domain-containing protein n=2 Tax=Parcubacteria group TaxID=1794811 RepID=A0A2M7Q6L6_9BACT|nr:MAG: hypothetical protein AUK15_00125 [Candidatus Nomurabacteria bacterium CG2_30_43_9]PIQ35572.1 MAG: hypothetical protein COW60_03380 [Candidatus Yonathbacteria bacterium CG17_big_fil_post_rev_8_21_14_2_50_43_9]PIR40494.1 MAG: hypothetical protein COV32_03115 [Candidatus Yonathbacteria bacterium CG10_big_fil_rev_8_21_14_0_10_43_136]PIX57369.1 MAG: hypothetical protein COZ48_01055 [Candidatus Yonathbacteria bacterium CG_4_10_14_3_um_filter_43_12]PIY58715.1 MAG: hypothetical protein COY98_00